MPEPEPDEIQMSPEAPVSKDTDNASFGERLRLALKDSGPMNGAWWRPFLHRMADAIDEDAARLTARVAKLEAEVESELAGQVEISEGAGRMLDKLQARIAELEAKISGSG